MATKSPNDTMKDIYICYPDNPNHEDSDHEYSHYTKKVFLQTVNQFVAALGRQEGIRTISRSHRSTVVVEGEKLTEQIEKCDCVVLICCPSLVYLLSDSSLADNRLEENQCFVELKTICGKNISHSRFRIIPVFLNASSDSLHKHLPVELGTISVSVCITTLAEAAEELWPAQLKSIEKLVKIIRGESHCETPASPGTEMDEVDVEWCLHFVDQFAIDFISCVFEDRNIYTDNSTLEQCLCIQPTHNISIRELFRIWLRMLRKRKFHSVFEEMRLILGKLGREDLMYQLKSQYEFYKEEVYQEQNIKSEDKPTD